MSAKFLFIEAMDLHSGNLSDGLKQTLMKEPKMNDQIDVYYSFRSPYSYLASPDMLGLKQDYDVPVNLRVILPIAVREPGYFKPGNEKWARYILLDRPRRSEFLCLPHAWPDPDPIVQDIETLEIAADQL